MAKEATGRSRSILNNLGIANFIDNNLFYSQQNQGTMGGSQQENSGSGRGSSDGGSGGSSRLQYSPIQKIQGCGSVMSCPN